MFLIIMNIITAIDKTVNRKIKFMDILDFCLTFFLHLNITIFIPLHWDMVNLKSSHSIHFKWIQGIRFYSVLDLTWLLTHRNKKCSIETFVLKQFLFTIMKLSNFIICILSRHFLMSFININRFYQATKS